jgi:Fe-S-cluster containining protein
MEFEINFDAVEKITSQEYAQARAELAEAGPVQALRHSLARHDQRLAAAADAPRLACKAGCYWCCYFSVDVRAVEVFNILEHVERELSAQEQARIYSEIATNSALLKSLPEDERVQRNIKCPFLNTGRCTIYSARPQTCRNYHATNVSGCEQSFNEPENLDIDPDFAPLVYQTGGAHVDAFATAVSHAGYDVKAYELNVALAAALENPNETRRLFDAKQAPFADLQGVDVPSEWMSEEN